MNYKVALIRTVSEPAGGGPFNGMYALQKGLRELLEWEPRRWEWFGLCDDPRQAEIPWFWCWEDRGAAREWASRGGKFLQGPNLLFLNSFQPRCDQHECFLLDTESSLVMFCHSEWYRDLIRSHRGSGNRSPILIWPYPIEPIPPAPDPCPEYDLLIYAKSGSRPRLVENLQSHFPNSRTFTYGQFRRDDFWQAAARSRAAVYLSDDDHGPLSLAELQLTGCPTVGIPRGAPFVEHAVNGILLPNFPEHGDADNPILQQWLDAIAKCQRMDRLSIHHAAKQRYDRLSVAKGVLSMIKEAIDHHDQPMPRPASAKAGNSRLKTISIALVTWPRFQHRRESFAKTVTRIKEFVAASRHRLQWVCSSESAGVTPAARSWLESFCRQYHIELSFRSDAADLGSNMNAALNLASGDYVLLVQDDIFFHSEVDLSDAAEFLDQHPDYALVRYGWVFTQFNGMIAGSDFRDVNMSGPYPYADEPHLRRSSFRNEFGMFVEHQGYGGPENELQHVLRKNHWKVAATRGLKCDRDGVPSTAPARWKPDVAGALTDEIKLEEIEQIRRSHEFAFVAGLHRSGTSVLTTALGEHPDVSALQSTGVPADEGQHLQRIFPAAHRLGGPGRFGFHQQSHLTEQSPLAIPENADQILRSWIPFWDVSRGVLLEKSPPNLLKTRFLQALFDSPRFIVITRHPIAVAMSTNSWCGVPFQVALKHWLVCYERFHQDLKHLRHCQLIHYEDLCSTPADVMSRIHQFLGLSSHPVRCRFRTSTNQPYFERWHRLPQPQRHEIIDRYQSRCEQLGYSLLSAKVV